jgi:two-component system, chemotaxis family, protein-glutamate methylesterase/glutaminase
MRRLIVVGASAGGVHALQQLAAALPADLPAAVLVVLHIGAHTSLLPELLTSKGNLPAQHASHRDPIRPGRIYVAPPDHHMLVVKDAVELTRGPKEHHSRPAVDPLFLSAGLSHGPAVVGVVLTGMLDDGTAGLQAVKMCGGTAIVQDPDDAFAPSMPLSALRHVDVDHCVPLRTMPALLTELAAQPAPEGERAPPPQLVHELALMLNDGDPMDHLNAIGAASPFACPDCHGTLWSLQGAAPAAVPLPHRPCVHAALPAASGIHRDRRGGMERAARAAGEAPAAPPHVRGVPGRGSERRCRARRGGRRLRGRTGAGGARTGRGVAGAARVAARWFGPAGRPSWRAEGKAAGARGHAHQRGSGSRPAAAVPPVRALTLVLP